MNTLQQLMDELHQITKREIDEQLADEAAKNFGLTAKERDAYLRSIRVSV